MKKIFFSACTVVFCVLFLSIAAYAQNTEAFAVVSVEYPEGEELFNENYQEYVKLALRYADTGEPIPMCEYYDGYMYATVPSEFASRPIEVFSAECVDFSDNNEEYEFYCMQQISRFGIVKGDEDGRANPVSEVTRAEAAAMVMRLMGAADGSAPYDGKFDDVSADDWYSGIVTNAVQYGIVAGDSENIFNPQRSISREEFTVMLARMLWKMGIKPENDNVSADDISIVDDAEKISDWAIPAYYTLGYNIMTDYEYMDLESDGTVLAKPQVFIKRSEIANMIMSVQSSMQYYPSRLAMEYGFDEKMPVIDGSTSTYPFTQAVYSNLFLNGYTHPDMPKSHSKSHVSYERLINGEVDMLFASVYPANDIKELAEKNGVELELIPVAYDAMVFFTNKDNEAENLTSSQITDIYVENKYDNWSDIGGPDAMLYPYCRNYDSGSHAQMERHFLNGKDINEKIRKESTSIAMANVLTDVMGSETDNPKGYGLGYSIYYYFKNMNVFYDTDTYLKLLSIDGVAPSDETIADGSYPLSNNTYIVIRGDSPKDSPERKMAQFMLTAAGQECVNQAGFGVLNITDEN